MGKLVEDRERPGAYFVRVGGTDQSYVDPEDPLYLEFDYVARIAEVIDAWRPPPERVATVHVGGGGLTLPRWLAASRPTSAQVVLEPDEELTAEVRAVIPLPARSGVKIRAVDGRAGLPAFRDGHAELLVVDAFAGGQVPGELATVEWFTECARVLAPSGLLVMNVTDKTPFTFTRRTVAALMAVLPQVTVGSETAIFKGRRFGNLVLAASRHPLPLGPLARSAAASPFPYRWLDPVSLPSWVAGLPPFTDDDHEPSPRPLTAFLSR